MNEFPLALALLLPALGALTLPGRLRGTPLRVGLAALLCAETLLAILLCCADNASLVVWRFSDGLCLAFRADEASLLFGVLFSVMALLACVFAFEYMKKERDEARFFRHYLLMLSSLMGVAYARNLFAFFVSFEATTLFCVPLVAHEETKEARRAALVFLGYSILGASVALFGLFVLNAYAPTTEFTPGGVLDAASIRGHEPLLTASFFLMAVGFGAKAGLFPLHAWLPVAHPVAPSPASAVLSGIVTKAGLVGILRVTLYLFGADFVRGTWAQTALLLLTLITVFMGSAMALRETHLKRRFAYSTVSQLSYALYGLFLLNPAGLSGALYQALFHAAAKDALFLFAGVVLYKYGYTDVSSLKGVGKRLPVTTVCFAVASLSLIGIPPMGGFTAKWYLATAGLKPGIGATGVWGACVLILSALLTAGYLLPIIADAFFPGRDAAKEIVARDAEPRLFLYPMVALALLCVLPALCPTALAAFFERLAVQLLQAGVR